MTVSDFSPLRFLRRAALRHPARTSMIWVRNQQPLETAERWTVAETLSRCVALSELLKRDGVTAGDRIAVVGRNSPWHLAAWVAGAAFPAAIIPLSEVLPDRDLSYILAQSSPKVVLCADEMTQRLQSIYPSATVRTWSQLAVLRSTAENLDAAATAIEVNRSLGTIPACDEQAGAIIYTSGTASKPKGCVLSYANLWWGCANFREAFEYSPNCVEGVCAPLSHIGGFNGTTTDLFSNGGTVVIFERFEPRVVLQAIAQFKIEMMFAVPTMFRLLAEAAASCEADTSSFTRALVGGAAWDTELAARLIALGWGPINIWGMTEQSASGACLTTDMISGRESAVGLPFPHLDVRVHDAELECRGPSVTSGYFLAPELNATAFTPDGWFRTGDLGFIDDSGFLHLQGRREDTINTGGEKVLAARVSAVLCEHPRVRQAAVIGIPDSKWGHVVAAVIVAAGAAPTLDELQEYAQPQLAKFEVPRLLAVVDALPLNAHGKPDREALSALFS